MTIKEKISQHLTIKNVSYPTFCLNITSIILGIIYITIPIYTIIWDIFGVILIISLFCNLLLIYLNIKKINKTIKIGKWLNIMCYCFLGVTIFAMLGMSQGIGNIQSTYSNALTANLFSYVLIYVSFFGLLVFGAVIAFLDIKNLGNQELWDISSVKATILTKNKKILKGIVQFFGYMLLLGGVLLAFGSISGMFEVIGWVTSMVFNTKTLFFVFIFISLTIFLLFLTDRKKDPILFYTTAIMGLVVSGIFLTPVLLTPFTVMGAEMEFATAYGTDWRSKIDPTIEQRYFLPTPFSLPQYFLGVAPKDCIVLEDILYYENATEGLTLRFDAYLPPASGLPGMNSTIISIHGGGWALGNKGQGSMIQRNKYFAAQGYCVFDIEYGLTPSPFSTLIDPPDPQTVATISLSIDDMVRHIGNFTHVLAANATKYGANLSSVFVNGGSAGGHLTMATALGIWSGNFTQYFNDSLIIKGMVPFYPGNGLSEILGISGNQSLVYPERLINSTSPPCLIYQGTSDVFCIAVTQRVQSIYKQGNGKCAVVWLPMAGHGNDGYFPGYFNLPFIYYMERFLYLCVYDLI